MLQTTLDPRVESSTQAPATDTRRPRELTIRLRESELFYRAWLSEHPSDRAVFLFHRGHEHSGRLMDVVAGLGLDDDVSVFAWDARGHGRSPGRRGYAPGFSHLVDDMDAFIHAMCTRHGIALERTVLVGHSVGAVLAAAWTLDRKPAIAGLVLVTPALRVKLYVPFALPTLRLMRRAQRLTGKPLFVKSYVKPRMLTHDREQARLYARDPLISRDIAVDVLVDMHDTASRLLRQAEGITVPTQILSAGSDWVVRLSSQQKFFAALGSEDKEMKIFERGYHGLLHEKNRYEIYGEMARFIERALN